MKRVAAIPRSEIWLYILLGLFILLPFEFDVYGLVIRPFDIAMVFTFFLIVLSIFYNNGIKITVNAITWTTVAIISLGLFSTLWALSPSSVVSEVIQWLEMLAFLVLVSSIIKSEAQVKRVSFVLLLLIIFLHLGIGLDIAQNVIGEGLNALSRRPVPRRAGFFGAIGLIWVIAFYPVIPQWLKKWLWIFTPVFILSLFFSRTRMSYLGTVLGVLVISFMRSKNFMSYFILVAKWSLVVIFLLLLLYILYPELTSEQFYYYFETLTNKDEFIRTNKNRFCRIGIDFNRFLDRPILGVGLNNRSVTKTNPYLPPGCEIHYGSTGVGAHNSYLTMLVELGIVGLILYFVLTLYPIKLFFYWLGDKQRIRFPAPFVFFFGMWVFLMMLILFLSGGLVRRLLLFLTLGITTSYMKIISKRQIDDANYG